MVRGSDNHVVTAHSIYELQECVDYALKLPVLKVIVAVLGNGIKLIEQDHHGARGDEVENLTEVCGGLAEVGRDHHIKADRGEREKELPSHSLSCGGLSTSRWTTQQQPGGRCDAISAKNFRPTRLEREALQVATHNIRQNKLIHLALRLDSDEQGETTITVLGDVVLPRMERAKWLETAHLTTAVEEALKFPSHNMVIFTPFSYDQGLDG